MYLVISQVKIEQLQKYHYCADGKMSFEEYANSPEGKELFAITPLIIDPVKDKKNLAYQIAMDVAWLSLCYNSPLNIYVMIDNWWYKNMHFIGLQSRRNFGKCSQMSNKCHLEGYAVGSPEVQSFRVPQETTYYQGDIDVIEQEIAKIVLDKSFNMREKPIQYIRVTARDGFKLML